MQLTDVAPDDLFITEELDARPCGAADYRQETLAIQELAARMADDPDAVLPKFVELAMEITGGVAGGLSLFEAGPEPVFRWTGLRGSLEEFDGAATPRHFSPCGVTLDRNGVVLCRHPERFYDWVPQHLWLPEVLLVPLYMGGTEPLGTLWVVAGKPEHFTRDHARILGELAAFVGIAVRMRRGQQALRQELADQVALTQEMSHRVRNVFAVTDGMIRISAKNAADKDEMARSLSGRLHALSSAHALVSRNLHRDENRQQGDIASLLRAVTAPHETGIGAERFHVAGPVIVCGDHAMTGLALIFHEMATNSAKYGALSNDHGAVEVDWREEGGAVLVSWNESGGPPVRAPVGSTGFGASLVRSTAAGQFAGTVDYDWREEGVRVNLRLARERLAV